MKIRNGFVSNSSSSSFVMVGITRPLTELTEIKKRHILEKLEITIDSGEDINDFFADAISEKGLEIFEGSDGGMPEDKFALGEVVATLDDSDCFEYTDCDIAKVLSIQEKVQDLLDVKDQAKIIATTRAS